MLYAIVALLVIILDQAKVGILADTGFGELI